MFKWPVRVYWEDTDAGGIVFYANYLKFFERSRTEWLRHLGLHQQRLRDQTGGMFVVTHSSIDYLQSARLDDELVVTTQLQQMGRASLHLQQTARRGETDLCKGLIVVGWVDAQTMRPTRMPLHLVEALRNS